MEHLAEYQKLSEDLGQLANLSTALENYAEILQHGSIPVESGVGKAICIGLESIDPTIDIKEGGMITLRAIKDGVVKAAKATRHAIKILFEWLSSVYVKFTGSLTHVRNNHQRVSRRLSKLGSKVTYKKMEVSGINRLSINGSFAGDDLNALSSMHDLTDYILNNYPRAITQVARDCSREFMNIVVRQDGNESNMEVAHEAVAAFSNSLVRNLRVPNKSEQANMRELPPSFKDAGQFHRSEVMPGNYALVFTHPQFVMQRVERTKVSNYGAVINQAFSLRFVELSLKSADRSARMVDVPSVKVLAQLLDRISSILAIAEKGSDGRRDFDVVKSIVDDTIRQVADRNDNIGNANNVILHMLGAISAKLAEPMGNYTHWLAVTLNIYLTYIDHCIKHYMVEGV